jgi:hypothetical protein
MVKVSIEKAVHDMRSEFRDLMNAEFNTGVARAINHTIAKGKTASSKEIRQVYNITAKDVGQSLSIRRANKAQLYGSIIAQGKPLPIYKFKPSQGKYGVSVLIKKGNRQLVKGTFLATMASGHVGVFARGTYKGGKGNFNFRNKRIKPAGGYALKNGRMQPVNNDLNVNEITTVSVPRAFANKVVLRNLASQLETEFPARMMHELSRIRKG